MSKNELINILDELKEDSEKINYELKDEDFQYGDASDYENTDNYNDTDVDIYGCGREDVCFCKSEKKALILGSAVIDEIIKLDKLPKSGDDVKCLEKTSSLGGCAYNIACTMRNLGSPHELCVPIGTGKYADEIRERLYERGYREMIRDYERDNGYCICLVESDGERSFITVNGAESDFKREWLELIDCDEYDVICVSGYQMCGESGRVISEWLQEISENKTIFFAPGPLITKIEPSTMERMLSLSPVIHINEKEACDFSGKENVKEASEYIESISGNMVIVTLGEKGALAAKDGEIICAEGFKSEVEDTIGAGDSHLGAVITGFINEMDVYNCLRLANIVASKIVAVKGAVMQRDELQKELNISEFLY